MKKLIVCEKRKEGAFFLSEGLGEKFTQGDGFLESQNYIITWAMGHMFALEVPERLDPSFGLYADCSDLRMPTMLGKMKFVLDDDPKRYPFSKSQQEMVKAKAQQYARIRAVFKRNDYDEIILAADADAEGERIHTDILEDNLKYAPKGVKVTRFWNSGSYKAKDAVDKALRDRKPYTDPTYTRLLASAKARGVADYLVGMKMTKVASAKFVQRGFLSVGRVQSPIIGMIGRREDERKNFKPKPYWTIFATYKGLKLNHYYMDTDIDDETGKEISVRATKYLEKLDVDEIMSKTADKKGIVESYSKRKTSSNKPKLYSTSDFNGEFMSKTGCSMEQSQWCLEYLREQGYTTYPRTDGNYFATADFEEVESQIKAALEYLKDEINSNGIKSSPLDKKNKIFDDKKAATQNHTPLMTIKAPTSSVVQEWEGSIKHSNGTINAGLVAKAYDLIARRVAIQVLQDDVVEKQGLVVDVHGYKFEANADKYIDNGWRTIAKDVKKSSYFDDFVQGDTIILDTIEKDEKTTTIPPRYTEATLSKALLNVTQALRDEINAIEDPVEQKAKLSEFKKIRAILTSAKGIGTNATRPQIIKNLLNRKYIEIEKKEVKLTPQGQILYEHLPKYVLALETTAKWEEDLDAIRIGNMTYDDFVKGIDSEIMDKMIAEILGKKVQMLSAAGGATQVKPTAKQISFAESIAKRKNIALPKGYKTSMDVCRQFIDANVEAKDPNAQKTEYSDEPSEAQLKYVKSLAEQVGRTLTEKELSSRKTVKALIDELSEASKKVAKYTLSEARVNVLKNPRNADKVSKKVLALLDKKALTKDEFDECLKALDKIFKK